MKTNWTKYLGNDVYMRLCECRTIKSDLPMLVNAKWLDMKDKGKDKEGWTKEDALVNVLELLDCNSISWAWDLTKDEYNELKGE